MKKIVDETQYWNAKIMNEDYERILLEIYQSLEERGYDPVAQIMGYIISGNPTYITTYNNARKMLCEVAPNDLLIFFVKEFFRGKKC